MSLPLRLFRRLRMTQGYTSVLAQHRFLGPIAGKEAPDATSSQWSCELRTLTGGRHTNFAWIHHILLGYRIHERTNVSRPTSVRKLLWIVLVRGRRRKVRQLQIHNGKSQSSTRVMTESRPLYFPCDISVGVGTLPTTYV